MLSDFHDRHLRSGRTLVTARRITRRRHFAFNVYWRISPVICVDGVKMCAKRWWKHSSEAVALTKTPREYMM